MEIADILYRTAFDTLDDVLYLKTSFFMLYIKDLQPLTKYLRVTGALREKLNSVFQEIFASIDKIFILAERLGQ